MRIVVAGSSGFLGSPLVAELRARGHDVVRLVRRQATADDESSWDPYADRLDPEVIATADAVVNVAGSPTIGNPYSKKWARALQESRVTTTRLLAERIASAPVPPAFIAGNAIGWYGDHGNDVVTESSDSRGDSFMTGVCRAWQDATGPAVDAGSRVCVLRTAPIMDRGVAPLKQLAPLFRLGLGARLGDGRQYFAMVSLRDWLGGVVHLVEHDAVSGPVNVSCPIAPTNQEFTDALARAVGRKARLAAPSLAIKVGGGILAPEALGSMRIEPAVLTAAGYTFRDEDVDAVIAAGLS